MKENVEVVVKVGLTDNEKLMTIMTTSRDNVRYDTLDYGATGFYRLQIKNANIIKNEKLDFAKGFRPYALSKEYNHYSQNGIRIRYC